MKAAKVIFISFLVLNALMQGFFGFNLTFNTQGAIKMFDPTINAVTGPLLQNSVLLGTALLFSVAIIIISLIYFLGNKREGIVLGIAVSAWTFSLGLIGLVVLGTPQFLLFDSIRASIPLLAGMVLLRKKD